MVGHGRADGVAVARVSRAAANASEPEAEPAQAEPEAEPAQAEPEAEPAQAEPEDGVRVRTLQPTRRRARLDFGPAPRELRLADLTEEQVEQLLSDPVLMVERIAIPVAATSGA